MSERENIFDCVRSQRGKHAEMRAYGWAGVEQNRLPRHMTSSDVTTHSVGSANINIHIHTHTYTHILMWDQRK